MKNLKRISLIVLFATMSTAMAQNTTDSSHKVVPAEQHIYVGTDLGIGGMQTDKNIDPDNYSIGGFAYGIHGGYTFRLSPKLIIAAELGYLGYADNKYFENNNLVYSGHTIEALANTRYQFNDNWFGFVKAGVGYVTQRLKLATDVEGFSLSEVNSKVLPEAVLGVGYKFNTHLSTNFSFRKLFASKQHINTNTASTPTDVNKIAPIGVASLGVDYSF